MRRVLGVLLVLSVPTGVTAQTQISEEQMNRKNNNMISPIIHDKRPPEEGKQKTLSLGIWSCNDFIIRLGGGGETTDRIEII
ncbi:MAG: hypothetical protein LBV50_07935 [Novosphingobium sp.]|jgi:hypothetical protein|nr:hypothetical protein [Novosphingobium sp.]